MPKNKLQSIIFTILMAFVMVYGMICYNISLDMGGMKNEIFLLAFHEIIIMLPVAFILEFFVVEKLSTAMAFRIVTPNDRPFVITLAISCMIVLCMCPTLSLVATVLFKQPGKELIAAWFQTTVLNFPMALLWQLFFAGPVVRFIFGKLFPEKEPAGEAA